ncbi:hypothetical protein BTS2_3314 [Bacillus sp. TS-2]|nr:hypothetical protein BTS2_3314 [Bacillus sp. TS-2]
MQINLITEKSDQKDESLQSYEKGGKDYSCYKTKIERGIMMFFFQIFTLIFFVVLGIVAFEDCKK